MLAKFIKFLMFGVIVFSFGTYKLDSVNAASVMWGKTELKLGQIGKATILADTTLVKIESDGSLSSVRALKKGEEYRVYSYKGQHSGLYGVGGGNFIQKDDIKVKYETPSKAKIALLKDLADNPQLVAQPSSKPTQSTKPSVGSGFEVIPGAPTSFQNCTAMKKYYPNGVKEGHPAYAAKHDRDKDGWACEPNK